jgi:hypothetical protein
MSRRHGIVIVVLLMAALGTSCRRSQPHVGWRKDCPPIAYPAPLGLDAVRDAHRRAERRQDLKEHEAATPGFFRAAMHAALDPARIAAGQMCLSDLADLGQLVFEHEYAPVDGLGAGNGAAASRGPFRRVHGGLFGGPETISCPSCHWVGGPNGAGAETDNAFLQGDGERPGSGDARNPPALLGLGIVEALAREMTADLAKQRANLVREAARAGRTREHALTSKGVDFGVLRVSERGAIDASGLRGIDADLIVKPFGWKGTLASFSDFAVEALQVHHGIQSDRLLATHRGEMVGGGTDADDPDADGLRHEIGPGPIAAMAVHLALLAPPIVEPLIQDQKLEPAAKGMLPPTTTNFADDFARGRQQFQDLGCAACHRPMLVLKRPVLVLDGMPPIDLAHEMEPGALRFDQAAGGYPVWLFSDLKRHDMGAANAAQHVQSGVAVRDYLTPRLWGVADSAPYLHDGRAPSLDYAMAGHDGEGAAARAAYMALPFNDKGPLRVYLMSLRRVPRVVVP